MFLCGHNSYNQLGEQSNNESAYKSPVICPPKKSRFTLSTLLSISTYFVFTVIVNKQYQAYGIGNNEFEQISPTLPKRILEEATEIKIEDKDGQPFKFLSAVCGDDYTLYQVQNETSKHETHLIFAPSNRPLIFVNIFGRTPSSLFGGSCTSAVIDTEGSVIFLTKEKLNRTNGEASPANLPSGSRASSVACCNKFFIVVDTNGRLFESQISKGDATELTEVKELSGEKIVSIAGNSYHCFAVCEDGRVFGKGNNYDCKLGLPSSTGESDKFIQIESLNKYKIVSAFAGTGHSIFRTSTGKIIGCGSNSFGHLMLDKPSKKTIYPPIELPSFCSDPFFILGNCITYVMSEKDVPPNTPNRPIQIAKNSKQPKSPTKVSIKPSTSSETTSLNKKIDEQEKRIQQLLHERDEMKSKEASYKAKIAKLEEENKKLTQKAESKTKTKDKKDKEAPASSKFEILDGKKMSAIHRIRRIGLGGSSEVFEVSLETHYAQKLLLFEDEINMNDMKHLIREYEALISLNSPYIIRAFGISFGTKTEPPFILLELCPSNLKKRVKELTNSERQQIICEISEGMREVHRAGIIHGDLKLENILLDENNHVKLSDFGQCHLKNFESSMSHNEIGGTLKFMAPELFEDEKEYNEKVDVYSFGVVVFIIAQKGEFPKISVSDVVGGKKAKIPASVTDFTRELINRCWSFKPSDRPSFEEICEYLKGNEHKLI